MYVNIYFIFVSCVIGNMGIDKDSW